MISKRSRKSSRCLIAWWFQYKILNNLKEGRILLLQEISEVLWERKKGEKYLLILLRLKVITVKIVEINHTDHRITHSKMLHFKESQKEAKHLDPILLKKLQINLQIHSTSQTINHQILLKNQAYLHLHTNLMFGSLLANQTFLKAKPPSVLILLRRELSKTTSQILFKVKSILIPSRVK